MTHLSYDDGEYLSVYAGGISLLVVTGIVLNSFLLIIVSRVCIAQIRLAT